MRSTILALLLASSGFGQSLVEHSAAAAGGAVGGVAGKKVSDGLTAIFEKVDQHTQKAAKGAAPAQATAPGRGKDASKSASAPASASSNDNEPLFEVGPGVPKQRASVPPPPPPVHHAVAHHKTLRLPPARRVPVPIIPTEGEQVVQISLAELKTVTAGMSRSDVLRLGTPAARVTMYDDGHLVEIYRYLERDTNLGTVRLTDGSVSSVHLR
jgi:hypothetical protein